MAPVKFQIGLMQCFYFFSPLGGRLRLLFSLFQMQTMASLMLNVNFVLQNKKLFNNELKSLSYLSLQLVAFRELSFHLPIHVLLKFFHVKKLEWFVHFK